MEKLMKKGKSGFTLVELVIVIAILAIVAAIAIPTAANVIGNANKAADESNAQAIEMAIKTCQAEGVANVTNPSAIFQKVHDDTDKTVVHLLSFYGVTTTLTGLKQGSSYHYIYDSTSGKVIATSAAAGSGQIQLDASTTYKIGTDNTVTIYS